MLSIINQRASGQVDGFIVGYRMGCEQSINLVTMTVEDALKKEKVAGGLALHSDQGFQYSSHAYFRLTQALRYYALNVKTGQLSGQCQQGKLLWHAKNRTASTTKVQNV